MADRLRPVPLSVDDLLPSASTCMFAVDTGLCGKPAKWHVMWWPMKDVNTSMICPSHYAWSVEEYRIDDVHEVGTVCGHPEARWLPSTRTSSGTCYIDVDEDEAAVLSADLREPVGALS